MNRNAIKTVVAGLAVALAAALILPAASTGAASGNVILMTITVEALGADDEAVLRIGADDGSLELAGQPLYEYTVTADGGAPQQVDINPTLADGLYLLVIDALEKYFREPRGYSFRVAQGALVNPVGHSIKFKLIPPEARDYEIYRQPGPTTVPNFSPVVPAPPTGEVKYRVEGIIDLSAPSKQPIPAYIPSTRELIYQWWQVPQLRAAAVLLLVILGATAFVVVRTISEAEGETGRRIGKPTDQSGVWPYAPTQARLEARIPWKYRRLRCRVGAASGV